MRLALVTLAACSASEAAPILREVALEPVANVCATRGHVKIGETVTSPTMRAYALGTEGDAASVQLVYRGDTAELRDLATSGTRRQFGLKLRAHDGCNLVYVMWRIDPKPKLEVSLKLNPGAKNAEACGADGYTKIKPKKSAPLPELAEGDTHALRAAIDGDELTAWVDDHVVWRGTLPRGARGLVGPAGLRSDNLTFDLLGFSAPPAIEGSAAKCKPEKAEND